jgi:hypothetical protein
MRAALKEQENVLAQERQLAVKKAQAEMQSAVEAALAERDELLSLYSKVCAYLDILIPFVVIDFIFLMTPLFFTKSPLILP